MEQRDRQWHAARLGNLSGSRANDMMGTKQARNRYLVENAVEILTGTQKEFFSKYTEFGKVHEPAAIRDYEFQTGLTVATPPLIVSDLHPRFVCSPDGMVEDELTWTIPGGTLEEVPDDEVITKPIKGVVEVKSRFDVSKHVDTIFKNEIPKEYLPQCHWNMWVSNSNFCDYVSYSPDMPPKSQLHIIRLMRDDDYIVKMQNKALLFLRELDELVEKLL